mmetsp:Transcript_7234/g.10125  ORF Transcript_7234/g.10125 Transcript_7234/m.10125 type:complete len:175 (+) Transcript_7234:33-557(+)
MCGKKKVQIREHEVKFISICTKGEDMDYSTKAGQKRPLDRMYEEAQSKNALSQIINAADDEGDRPLHIACEFGNSEVVQWILDKKDELKVDIRAKNGNGLSSLFLVCLKGYVGADGVGSRTDSVKAKRLEIAKMLIEKGANIDFCETIGLTPLHWAAYNDDAELCRFLLANGAK